MLASPLLMDCGKKGAGGGPAIPGGDSLPGGGALPGGCPANIADAQAVMAANFGLEGELENKVKASLSAGAHLQEIAVELEAEVATACGNLAKDLGATDADLSRRKTARARRRRPLAPPRASSWATSRRRPRAASRST
jgi:hypothetical protein